MAKKKYKYKKASIVIGHDADGKPIRKYVYGKNATDRNNKRDELKRLYKSGYHLGDMTVYEWSERWQSVYLANVSEWQKRDYAARLRKDILPEIGYMRMRDVRTSHLIELINKHKGGRYGTVSKTRQATLRLFADAVQEGIIERNPSIGVGLPDTMVNKRRPLNATERAALLSVSKSHKHGAYALTFLYTGLRRGECIALLRSDIDLAARKITVNKSLDLKGANVGTLSTTKSSKLRKSGVGERTVPIPDLLLPVLTDVCKNLSHSDIVFPKCNGDYATQSATRGWWHSFKTQCHLETGADTYRNQVLVNDSVIIKIGDDTRTLAEWSALDKKFAQLKRSQFNDDISPHWLRHDYATMLYSAGVDIYARKAFLGHASSDVTDGYTAMSDDAFYRNLDLINSYLICDT